eukprot:TRINITY_DN7450_c0_g1_i1.p1 TRINITY_DN7450_c0_g1~~TRINITY_DN7450_c0_g1_i1.p1  ORF type:complete len:111 (-),score=33.40 TRINITY_DN7450_c0_g1_i1:9-341(-)
MNNIVFQFRDLLPSLLSDQQEPTPPDSPYALSPLSLSELLEKRHEQYLSEYSIKSKIFSHLSLDTPPHLISTYAQVWEAQPYLDKYKLEQYQLKWQLHLFQSKDHNNPNK